MAAVAKTFHKFTQEDLEAHKDTLLKRAKELTDTECQIVELQAKAAWLKNNLADLIRKIEEGGRWD